VYCPRDEYFRLTRTDKTIPNKLLKNFSDIPEDASGDMFGQIYEYFLGNFAMAEGQKGGEFFTPRSVVRLMVEIIEPHNGTVFDPACGSGGMFVQSAQFIRRRKQDIENNGVSDLFVYGQEKTLETVKLAKMNLAVNGLRGDIRQANTYYEDLFESFEKFDYILANPPFNVDDVNLERIENDKRFKTYGLPRRKSKKSRGKTKKDEKETINRKEKEKDVETVPNANYLWINLFATSLKSTGRAALVMANSASDARHSEADIRKKLVEKNLIYGMLTMPSNMFYTVTLPATLWFFDRNKKDNRILFIDARNIFTQIDRAHRKFSEEQVQNIALISRLHRGEREKFIELIDSYFEQGVEKLTLNKECLKNVSKTLTRYLEDDSDNDMPDFASRLEEINELEKEYKRYLSNRRIDDIDDSNNRQRELAGTFAPFFAAIHDMLKVIDKKVRHFEKEQGTSKEAKNVKAELNEFHKEIKEAEYFFIHINWLHERFPGAKYEDVTGLCKLATLKEIKEQDYSLNPGRYVGVVIEEDGKTEEEFIEEILALNDELDKLNNEAKKLEILINHNIRQLAEEK
jgi:type I restriction enzyme M protein